MNEWEPDQHVNLNGRNIYLWIVPGKAEGTWQAESGGRKFTLNLKQAFQKLTGTATVDGKSLPVTGRLTGNAIELSADLGGGATQLRGRDQGQRHRRRQPARHAVLTPTAGHVTIVPERPRPVGPRHARRARTSRRSPNGRPRPRHPAPA